METKPGIRTTEFWVTAVTSVLQVLNLSGAWNFVPNKYSVIVLGVVNAAYAFARGLAKAGTPFAEPAGGIGAMMAALRAASHPQTATPPAEQTPTATTPPG